MNFIQKVTAPILPIGDVSSFSLIGDPGCEGLGTTMMRVYVNALELASRDDFILIAGDMVPTGKRRFYETISEITNSVAGKDTYILRGNHDTGVYTEYFGLQNYALIGDSFTVVVLDNAMRTFEAEGLELLGRVLAMEECRKHEKVLPLPGSHAHPTTQDGKLAHPAPVPSAHSASFQALIPASCRPPSDRGHLRPDPLNSPGLRPRGSPPPVP